MKPYLTNPGLTFQAQLEWELEQAVRKAKMQPSLAFHHFGRFMAMLDEHYPDAHLEVDATNRTLTLTCKKWTTTRTF